MIIVLSLSIGWHAECQEQVNIKNVVEIRVDSKDEENLILQGSDNLLDWSNISTEFRGSRTFYLTPENNRNFYRTIKDGPVLHDIEIEGGSIHPTFDPHILRYSIRPNTESSELNLIFSKTDEEEVILINGNVLQDSFYSINISDYIGVDNKFEREIVNRFSVNNGSKSTTYEIVIVPSDFPAIDAFVDSGSVGNQKIITAFRNKKKEFSFLVLIDNYGVPYYLQRTPLISLDFKRHPNGLYSYSTRSSNPPNEFGRRSSVHIILDSNLIEIDRVSTVGLSHTDNHEFLILENGNYLMQAYEGRKLAPPPSEPDIPDYLEDTVIQEVTPGGEVVFQWNSGDFFSPSESNYASKTDYAHGNSLFVDFDGNIIASLRGVSQIVKIDRKNGDLVWRIGAALDDFSIANDPLGGFCGQHTATRVLGNNLLLFDNGQWCAPTHLNHPPVSRVVEYSLDFENRVASLQWSYQKDGVYTGSQGSAYRLQNGNTLISWGNSESLSISEVDMSGIPVLELKLEEPFILYRAYRLE